MDEQLKAAYEVERDSYLTRIRLIEAKGPQWDNLTVEQLRARVELVEAEGRLKPSGNKREKRPAGGAEETRGE